MNQTEAQQQIQRDVVVTRQMITLAKAFILESFSEDTEQMRVRLLDHFNATRPEQIVLHETIDAGPDLRQVAKSLSWQLAFGEALWALIGMGLVQPLRSNLTTLPTHQQWTNIVRGSSGNRSGWSFDGFRMSVPERVRLSPSLEYEGPQPLADPDLFLQELEIPDLHEAVEDALRLAVSCLRQDLFLPAVAMLGQASEGAWIEAGLALLGSCVGQPGLSSKARDEKLTQLQSPYTSILAKIDLVRALYDRKDVFQAVWIKSEVRPKELAQVQNWSNIVRDARNAIHYGAESTVSNTYEKVAVLLLGANQNIGLLYKIITSAKDV